MAPAVAQAQTTMEAQRMDDYSGPFDSDFHLGGLSRPALARLAREYQLCAHLQDRAGIPQVLARYGATAMREIAIAEWMGASPVYTQRMQRALGFAGNDVATIFKGMQFDVGAPHGFLDFRFRLNDSQSGEFWLPYCGALMDVEPMGEEFVVGMCHHIEDPTFDATAVATNPRARVRPIHRPPRQPADRVPHCHWSVQIDSGAPPLEEIPLTQKVRASRLTRLELSRPAAQPDGGLVDYSGAFDPDLQLEDFSHSTLVRIGQEFCVQGHLLVRSFMMALAERWGDGVASEIAAHQLVGIAGLAAERVAAAMRIGGGLDAVAKLFQLHPAFHPRAYIDLHVERGAHAVRCWIGDCEALAEGDAYSWFALLAASPEPHRALDTIARTVDRRARCRPAHVAGARLAWSVEIDPNAEPASEPPEVGLTKLSKGATFQFVARRPPRA
ncbi:MAG TPA: hypothetical protein VN812_19035 [Candidatus Acidoferrales bacterium]|nr:hypothetical protein [Candidatus Acidoferrales bacterium]